MNVSGGVMHIILKHRVSQAVKEGHIPDVAGWVCCTFMLPHAKRRGAQDRLAPLPQTEPRFIPKNLSKGCKKIADHSPVPALVRQQRYLTSFSSRTSPKD